MKNVISLLLCAMIILTLVVSLGSCSKGDGEDNGTTTSPAYVDAPADTAPDGDNVDQPTTAGANESDDLGDVRFNGYTYDILSRELTAYEVESSEISGDLVGDAVHTRNVTIEDRFGVNVNVIKKPGNWDNRDSFMATVTNSIMGGTHDYDLVMTHSAYIVNLALQGCGYDLYELENIDFSKKWWCQKYVDNAAVLGRAYTAMGDIGYTLYEYMECVFFNKRLADDAGVPDLYELVRSGEWTFDKLKEYALLVGEDLDGNGVRDSLDRYGFGTNNHACRMAVTFWDAKMTVPGADGRHVLNLPNEKYLAIYDELYSLVYDNPENVFFVSEGQKIETQMFMNDQLLFFVEKLGNAATMKDMTSEYGIVPFPKYDLEQQEYISSARDALSAIMVLSDITDPEMVGAITEAMCMLGYREITPAYYEMSLKLKYQSDPIAMEMLDLIRDTMTFDFAATYTNALGLIFSTVGDNIRDNNPSITSKLKVNAKVWQKQLEQLYESFEKLSK